MGFDEFLKRADIPEDVREAIRKDLADRRQAETALRDQMQMFRSILDSMSDGVVVSDATGKFVFFNRSAETMVGIGMTDAPSSEWGEMYGVFYPDGVTRVPEDRFPLMRALKGEKTDDVEQVIRNPHLPRPIRISVNGRPWTGRRGEIIGAVAVFRDVTELKKVQAELKALNETLEERVKQRTDELRKSEERFLQVQKMEAIGRLAGGVAHDFNNLLTAILGYADLALSGLRPDDSIRQEVQEIKDAGERAAGLTRQLLAFSRKQVLQPHVLNLNTVISDVKKMLHRLIGEDVSLKAFLSPSLGSVRADPTQIEQIILNLAVNARDAMPQGGRLTIETANVELDDAYARQHPSVQPGPYVMLAVSDTGTGMDRETLSRIFEPFFTTKDKGKGTGLGLSTVYGIVKQTGGNVWVYSEAGKGTTFKIYLPRTDALPEPARAEAGPAASERGTETILIAEDEEGLRLLAKKILMSQGYRVLEASHGRDALALCQRHADPIHLVLTDVVMPNMTGRELVEKLSQSHPRIKVLFMSGYSEDAIVQHGVLAPGTAFLEKPFTPKALLQKVREVLVQSSG